MKNFFLLLLSLCLSLGSYGQNYLTNGNFQTGMQAPWQGFNNQILTDELTNSLVGNVNNAEGSLFQTLNLEPGKSYKVAFNYRWVSGQGDYNMNVRAKDENAPPVFGNLVLDTLPDVWHFGTFSFTVPQGITEVRLVFYKLRGNRPLRIDNVYLAEAGYRASLADLETPVNAQPLGIAGDWALEFSDEFNATDLNLTKWRVSVSSRSRAPRPGLGVSDWWWVEENAFLDGQGKLVLRGTKVDHNTMHCGSVESRGRYEPTFGFLEARIKVAETAKGNHTAFWMQGSNQGNVDNSGADGAEVDIFESAWVTNTTKAVVHFDGYGSQKKNHTIPFNTPNLHNGFHVFGLHWTADSMNIYYDGVKVQSTNANKPFPFTVDRNGYPVVPQVPEWLWLSVGASFGDGDFQSQAVGTLSDALVDYVRVYQPARSVGIGKQESDRKIRIYPNPARQHIHLDSNLAQFQLSLFDLQGRLIRQSAHSFSADIDLGGLRKGIYLFQIESKNTLSSHRIIVE